MLHITNGDSAVAVLLQVLPGTLLPWRDVLHEGPVHADLSLADLSRERAAFIAQAGWGTLDKILDDFRERDTGVQNANRHEEVVLWFCLSADRAYFPLARSSTAAARAR